MQFRINATLLTSNLEVKKQTKMEEQEEQDARSETAESHASAKSTVFSVSSHFKNAQSNSKSKPNVPSASVNRDVPSASLHRD